MSLLTKRIQGSVRCRLHRARLVLRGKLLAYLESQPLAMEVTG